MSDISSTQHSPLPDYSLYAVQFPIPPSRAFSSPTHPLLALPSFPLLPSHLKHLSKLAANVIRRAHTTPTEHLLVLVLLAKRLLHLRLDDVLLAGGATGLRGGLRVSRGEDVGGRGPGDGGHGGGGLGGGLLEDGVGLGGHVGSGFVGF